MVARILTFEVFCSEVARRLEVSEDLRYGTLSEVGIDSIQVAEIATLLDELLRDPGHSAVIMSTLEAASTMQTIYQAYVSAAIDRD